MRTWRVELEKYQFVLCDLHLIIGRREHHHAFLHSCGAGSNKEADISQQHPEAGHGLYTSRTSRIVSMNLSRINFPQKDRVLT